MPLVLDHPTLEEIASRRETIGRLAERGDIQEWMARDASRLLDLQEELIRTGWVAEFPALFDEDGKVVRAFYHDDPKKPWIVMHENGKFFRFFHPGVDVGYTVGTVRGEALIQSVPPGDPDEDQAYTYKAIPKPFAPQEVVTVDIIGGNG